MRGRTLGHMWDSLLGRPLHPTRRQLMIPNRADTLMRHWQRPLVTGSRRDFLLELCDWMPLD